jgi:RNA polymerase sigma-70 factor (ECF subfamily)
LAINVAALYERYGPLVYRRCLRLLRDEAQAQDALHDVFVQLCSARDRIDDRALAGLLFRMATHVSLNRLRSRRRRPESADDALVQSIAAADGGEDGHAASRLLDRIFAREHASSRVIATLHFVDGMTLEEVAAEVGMSVSGVRKRLRVLRNRVALLVEEADGPSA